MKRFYTNRDLIKDRYGRMYRLPLELSRRGWEVEFFCPDFVRREAFVEDIEGMRFHSIPARFAGNWVDEVPWKSFKADLWLASGQLFAAQQAKRVACEQSVPWVLDFYDYYPAFFPKALRALAGWWGRSLVRDCDGFVGASEALVNWARECEAKTVCIGNGVDRSLFRPLKKSEVRGRHGFIESERLVGYFGSLDEERGLYDVVAGVKQLRNQDSNIRLVCAGTCSDRAALESVGAIWLGMLSQVELAEIINACDCALAPYAGGSQIAFSNSCRISEYLACGVPVVATRTGDYKHLLPKDYRGLANPNDAVDLAAAISRQLDRPEVAPLPREMDWDALGKDLDAFLNQVLVDSSAP